MNENTGPFAPKVPAAHLRNCGLLDRMLTPAASVIDDNGGGYGHTITNAQEERLATLRSVMNVIAILDQVSPERASAKHGFDLRPFRPAPRRTDESWDEFWLTAGHRDAHPQQRSSLSPGRCGYSPGTDDSSPWQRLPLPPLPPCSDLNWLSLPPTTARFRMIERQSRERR